MTFEMEAILASKRALRQKLAALPLVEKFRLLDELRARSVAIGGSRTRRRGSGTTETKRVPPAT